MDTFTPHFRSLVFSNSIRAIIFLEVVAAIQTFMSQFRRMSGKRMLEIIFFGGK